MSIISKCPKCQRAITVPDGIVSDASVRCPICEEEYPLSDALAEAPPALVPVGGSGDSDVLTAEMPGAAAAMAGAMDGQKAAEGMTEEEIEFDLDSSGTGEDSDQGKGVATAAIAAPKKKKKKGTFRMMAEPIIGGFIGLGLMYYGLNYFTGDERHDFLEVYLPGVPHTHGHWPGSGVPTEDQSQTPEPSPDPAAVAHTPQPSPSPSISTPPSTQPKSQPKSRAKRGLQDGGHALNKIPASHRTMASLMEEVDDLPPPMSAPRKKPADRGPPPLPENYIGPTNPPLISSDELGDALKATNEAITLQDAGAMDQPTYDKFRLLGESVTFARGWPDDTRLSGRKDGVERVLQTLGRDPNQPEAIGRLAKAFLDEGPGNQDGVLLSGKSGTPAERNGVHAAIINVTGQDSKVLVVSDKELPFDKDNNVVLLGTIVADPDIDITGLKEPLKWDRGAVVWLGSVANLDK